MGHELTALFVGGFWGFVAVLWITVIGAALIMPFALLSITRNIKQIRVQFERLNDTLESRGRTSPGGVLGI